jgi:hypothetical protein
MKEEGAIRCRPYERGGGLVPVQTALAKRLAEHRVGLGYGQSQPAALIPEHVRHDAPVGRQDGALLVEQDRGDGRLPNRQASSDVVAGG